MYIMLMIVTFIWIINLGHISVMQIFFFFFLAPLPMQKFFIEQFESFRPCWFHRIEFPGIPRNAVLEVAKIEEINVNIHKLPSK